MNVMNSNKRKLIKSKQEQVECEFCKKSFSKTSILVHIGKNESCKSHYGSRFDELKRKKNCLRKQKSREMLGKEKELKRQRESYAQNKKNKEKKRQYSQDEESKLANAEVWCFEIVKNTSRDNEANMKGSPINFDSPTTHKSDMLALHSNVIVLNPNQSQKSNVEKKDDKLEEDLAGANLLPKMNKDKKSEQPNVKKACKFCKKAFSLSTILKHLSHSAICKSSYGQKYNKLRRKIIKERKESQRQKKMSNDKNGIVDAPNSIINEESITSYSKDSNVLCKYCKKEFLSTSLLKHIARNEPCKLFYGVEFENLKKQSISIRKKEDYDKRMAKEDEERRKMFKEKQERKQMAIEKQEERKTDTDSQANAVALDKTQKSREEEERKQMAKKEERKIMTRAEVNKTTRRDILDSVVTCEFCKEKYMSSSILIHIGMNKSCKEHYGPKFDEMKKERKKKRMQLYRQRSLGPGRELDRQKVLYASDPKKKEKKKEYYHLNQEKIKVGNIWFLSPLVLSK